jgi:MYXO-CTERM domain-containing protein
MNRNLCTATALTVLFLLSGPANAQTTQPAPDQPTTTEQTTTGQTTDTAVQATRDDDEMDWGWIGLLGLIGLAGLMRRREPVITTRSTTVGSDTTRTGTRP